MHTRTHAHTHTCIHNAHTTHMHTRTHAYTMHTQHTHAHTHTCIHNTHMHTRTHIHTHIHTHIAHTHTHTHTCTRAHMHTRTHTHICTRTHAKHTHMHTYSCESTQMAMNISNPKPTSVAHQEAVHKSEPGVHWRHSSQRSKNSQNILEGLLKPNQIHNITRADLALFPGGLGLGTRLGWIQKRGGGGHTYE